MDSQDSTDNLLEDMLLDTDAKPTDLPLSLLKKITNNFSDDRCIGRGGFGVVYKGILGNGRVVAVKKLDGKVDIDEKKYKEEVGCLMTLKHKNIVRFLGYCADTQGIMCDYGGKLVLADVRQRLLCFEFLPNQNLCEYITDASCGLDWTARYQIIKGICDGLHYLHRKRVVHSDLKPANILLDDKMEPKIIDFGLSRCFDEKQSRAITSKLIGSPGYLAPEFYSGVKTFKSDLYSLGVIIQEMLTGQKGYSEVERVLESWRNRSGISSLTHRELKQIEVCADISINCMNSNPESRPDIRCIIKMLVRSDMSTSSVAESSQLVPHTDQLAEIERQRSQDRFPGFVKDEDLVGIEENRKLLTGWIYSEELGSTVITVSGMGGLGKSTLVTNIYEREKVYFPVHAWIVVSQIYTVESLLRKLLWKIGHMEPPVPREIDKMDVYDLKEEIKIKLQNIKYLIVLDDVWDQEVYIKIHDAFQAFQGSRIIITTRNARVAALASYDNHLELQPLCGTDAFELFCRRAFHNKKDHKCPTELQEIAVEIVKRCHGLPLAVVKIGSLLSSRPQINIWNQTYNRLQSELSTDDRVRAILNLSYHDLSEELRHCFLYCSLFPEDYPMSCETLVRLWVAEGFVLSKEKITPEEVAEGNLMELIHCNMLEVVDSDELGRVSTCKMHDIMRDLALCVAKEEKFGSANEYGELVQVDKNVRRLSLCGNLDGAPIVRLSLCGWNVKAAPIGRFPRLRTLVAQGIISFSPDMLSSIMFQSSYLTVLELRDSEITEVPASIGNFFNLRYIGLRRTKVKSLPESIEKLFNLQTLDIKQTQIEKLPRGIVKVKKLRHLLADRYADEKQSEFRYFIGVEAPEGLLNLEELQTLETVQASKDLAEQLNKLMQLRSIWIDNVSTEDSPNLFATLSTMPLLSSLLISARDENETLNLQALAPKFPKLHRLIVRGRWAHETLEYPIFHYHGKHLKYLALSWCQLGVDPLGVLAPHVPNLTYLSFNRVKSTTTLVLPAGCFPHLKTLVLKKMPNVEQLEIGHGALPCIEGLYILALAQLDKVPQGIETLISLKKLWLLYLHREFRTQWLTNGMHQKMQHVREIRV